MDKIRILIGRISSVNGRTQDATRPVEFKGQKLAEYLKIGYDNRTGNLTDTRGITQTLYRTEAGRFIVHIEDWSRWQNEPTTYSLREVGESDLSVNGEFEALGREAGYGRPLALEEVLE
jgi:hypothetical protein